jgi:excisionase family DNA binding protein
MNARTTPDNSPSTVASGPRLLLTPEGAAARLAVGRTTVYALLASGRLKSVQIGRSRRVPVSELGAFVAALTGNQPEDGPSS